MSKKSIGKKPLNNGEIMDKTIKRDEKGKIQKGVVLNPNGRPKGALSWSSMLRKTAEEDYGVKDDGTKVSKMEAIAKKMLELAIAGDVQAIKEFGDRLDGKAKQQIEGDLKLTLSSLRDKYVK